MAQPRVLAREAGVRYHGRTNTRDLKSNWEVSAAFFTKRANGYTIFFLWFLCFFKDYKSEVPSHSSFESQLCETLKNPHAIRKKKDTELAVLWFVLHPSKKRQGVFFFVQEGQW